jgi:hypothetical protein
MRTLAQFIGVLLFIGFIGAWHRPRRVGDPLPGRRLYELAQHT